MVDWFKMMINYLSSSNLPVVYQIELIRMNSTQKTLTSLIISSSFGAHAKISAILAQKSDEFENKGYTYSMLLLKKWLHLKADIFLSKLVPTFTLVFFGIKKLQSFEKFGPEVFETSACGNLLPKMAIKS